MAAKVQGSLVPNMIDGLLLLQHLTSAQDSCSEAYKYQWPASVVESNQAWHHLAVTWTAAANGSMRIFIDGLLMNTVRCRSMLLSL